MNTETKVSFTPGPWEISRDAVPEGYVQSAIYGPTGVRVATVFETEANVRLIAAAPDLLEALRLVLDDRDAGCLRIDTRKHIKRLIYEVTE